MTFVLRTVLLAVVVCASSGCGSSIVGAECAKGYSACDGVCVDVEADFHNCGACGIDCGQFACDDGMCSTSMLRPDAGQTDGSTMSAADSGVNGDGGFSVGFGDGGFNPNPGLSGCNFGETACGDLCLDLQVSRDACGMCGHACAFDEVCSAGECKDVCEPPLTFCDGSCFDLTTDQTHCGGCSTACESGLCEDSKCIGAVPGFVVVIGHDYSASAAPKGMDRIAGNAVLSLPRGAPVRVLEYRGNATDASVRGVHAAIAVVEAENGRESMISRTSAADVPALLREADVFVIHAQPGARNAALAKLGVDWGNALARFVALGRVIVLFDAPSSANDGTFRILEAAKLFEAGGRTSIANQTLRVIAPGLSLTANVPDRYVSSGHSVRFTDAAPEAAAIVVDGAGQPVVLQRIILP